MKRRKKKARTKWIVTSILSLILIPVLLVNTILILKRYLNPNHLPDILGIKPTVVRGSSMTPLFDSKSLIFVKEVNTDQLKRGDVICYLSNGETITHRIEDIYSMDGMRRFVTKGDQNEATDLHDVAAYRVEGQYIGRLAGMAGLAKCLQTVGMFLFIMSPIALYLLLDGIYRRKREQPKRYRTTDFEKELSSLRALK